VPKVLVRTNSGSCQGLQSWALVGSLALGAQLERSQADIRQWENSGAAQRLGFAAPDLVACSLEMPPYVDIGGVEGDICPSESECFTTTQAENEDQHVGRIPRVPAAPGRDSRRCALLIRVNLTVFTGGYFMAQASERTRMVARPSRTEAPDLADLSWAAITSTRPRLWPTPPTD
jgi:hypothetical protein